MSSVIDGAILGLIVGESLGLEHHNHGQSKGSFPSKSANIQLGPRGRMALTAIVTLIENTNHHKEFYKQTLSHWISVLEKKGGVPLLNNKHVLLTQIELIIPLCVSIAIINMKSSARKAIRAIIEKTGSGTGSGSDLAAFIVAHVHAFLRLACLDQVHIGTVPAVSAMRPDYVWGGRISEESGVCMPFDVSGSIVADMMDPSNYRDMTYLDIKRLNDPYRCKEHIDEKGMYACTLAAMWSLMRTNNFCDGLAFTLSLACEPSTAGAIFGQLAGSLYGVEKIPWKLSD